MRIIVGDITKLNNVEVIVSAANGVGPMGKGVAGAIGYAGGPELRNAVRRICEAAGGYNEGDCYVSPSGDMEQQGILAVYHAVTMRYPGSPTSVDIVDKAMRATLVKAILDGRKSIAFPGLGTGVGGLNPQTVAAKMVSIAESFSDKINITIIDIDKDFIAFAKQSVKAEN